MLAGQRIIKDAPEQKDPTLHCDAASIRFPVESDLMWAVIMGSPLKYPHNDDRTITAWIKTSREQLAQWKERSQLAYAALAGGMVAFMFGAAAIYLNTKSTFIYFQF